MHGLPRRKSPRWRAITVAGWLLVTAALWGIRFVVLNGGLGLAG